MRTNSIGNKFNNLQDILKSNVVILKSNVSKGELKLVLVIIIILFNRCGKQRLRKRKPRKLLQTISIRILKKDLISCSFNGDFERYEKTL